MSKKAGSTRKGGRKYLLLLPFIAVLLVIGIAADILYPTYSQVINGALTDRTRAPEEPPGRSTSTASCRPITMWVARAPAPPVPRALTSKPRWRAWASP